MKYLKYFLLGILRLILIFFGAGYILITFYGDEIKNRIIGELNEQITVKIEVKSADFSPFSFFSDFPNVSLNFHDVTALSNPSFNRKDFKENADTLFQFELLSLQFDISDIWNENYEITHIRAEKGRMNVFIDKNGNENYIFWNSDSSSENSTIVVSIEDLKFRQVDLRYIDLQNEINIDAYCERMHLNGEFSSENYVINSSAELYMRQLKIDDINYIPYYKVNADLQLDVAGDTYKIQDGNLAVAGMNFDVDGVILDNETTELDLQINGKDLNVQSFLSLIPKEINNIDDEYKSSGDFYFTTSISGKASARHIPHIETSFGIKNGAIINKESGIKLDHVVADGSFTNGINNSTSTSCLHLKKFEAKIDSSSFSGEYKMTDLNHPDILLKVSANSDLGLIKKFVSLDTLEIFEGRADGSFEFSGKINDPGKITSKELSRAKTSGNINLQNVTIKLKGSDKTYNELSGNLNFDNTMLQLDNLVFKLDESHFETSIKLFNFLNYVLVDNQELKAKGSVIIDDLKLDEMLEESENSASSKLILPENIQTELDIKVGKFKYDNFEAEDVSGRFESESNKIRISDLQLKTMSGNVYSAIDFVQLKDYNFLVRSKSKLEHINIPSLFESFSNFGQDYLTSKNLKGFLDADVYFSSTLTNDLAPVEEDVFSDCKMKITDGALLEFEPMMELSKYIAVEDLMNVNFSELTNDIHIENRMIYIPQMDIKSNAINMSLSGEHSFDNVFSYNVKVLLSEILFNKAKKKKKEVDEFGRIEDDGLGKVSLYLLIKGNSNDIDISYNKKKVKENIKDNYKSEKEEIKNIFKEEFTIFKKDSIDSEKKKDEKSLNGNFVVDDDKNAKINPVKISWNDDE